MSNIAIIGSLFGDEGKGRSVDYFAKTGEFDIVVRYSGSNNAAHTVVLDKNTKYVFNTLGAGSFRNLPTYLSKHVVVDPIALVGEIESFKSTFPEYNSIVYIDPRSKVCLPYDALLNRLKEFIKGNNRNGSTGNGLNECIDRSEVIPITLQEGRYDYSIIEQVYRRFVSIVNTILKSDIILDAELSGLINMFVRPNSVGLIYDRICKSLLHKNIRVMKPNLSNHRIIFEGSQGLMLDEYSSHYPHVTRSRTGVPNIIDICREFDIKVDDVYYIARPYFSRHGRDIFFKDNSEKVLKKFNIVDPTNIHNNWQGSLYFDFFDYLKYSNAIESDFKMIKNIYPEVNDNRIFSCMDQYINQNPELYPDDINIYNEKLNIKRKCNSLTEHGIKEFIFFDSPINN